MPYFRKKPVVIEARQLNKNKEEFLALCKWIGDDLESWSIGSNNIPASMRIRTLEGEYTAKEGDWIIRGVRGEFYPCDKSIFEETYESAEHTNS